MRFETVRVLLSLGVSVVLFVLSLPILIFALIALAFSVVAAGGIYLLEFLRAFVPGTDPSHMSFNGLPPFVQVILGSLAMLAAIGLFLSPVLIAIMLVARAFRAVCMASLGSIALLIICVVSALPFLGADFFLNGRNVGEIVFYILGTGVLHAAVAGLAYYDLRLSLNTRSPLGNSPSSA